ncbi:MAG: PilX N-terminal domain-containing pilus assembly protein [Methylobacter sp.]|jgi:Tfp pilus assembly protein PilX
MNHEAMRASNQRGAVLIFSLIMLLLLTLVSVSMIQQNKQELAMAGNALEQTKTLASAETKLKLAEQEIVKKRYALANLGDPIPGNRKCDSGNLINNNTAIGNATVTAVYCLKNNTETLCDPASCMCNLGTEIYTINLVEDTGSSRRTVESKYAVDCSGGPF